jgi:hypothetical protein
MSKSYTSKKVRQDSLLLRNDFNTVGKWGIPAMKKSEVDVSTLLLMGADKIKIADRGENLFKSVHFFIDDNKLDRYYNTPERYLERLAQYPHIFTPDYSLYTDMPPAIQIHNTFKSRWCGAYWQEHSLSVIPTVSWSTEDSYEFCFDGLEHETVVAISTLGALTNKELFLKGYFEMKKRIQPPQVLCFGKAFPEMGNEIIAVDYLQVTGRAS